MSVYSLSPGNITCYCFHLRHSTRSCFGPIILRENKANLKYIFRGFYMHENILFRAQKQFYQQLLLFKQSPLNTIFVVILCCHFRRRTAAVFMYVSCEFVVVISNPCFTWIKIKTSIYKSYNLDILSYTNISYLKIPIEKKSIESNFWIIRNLVF